MNKVLSLNGKHHEAQLIQKNVIMKVAAAVVVVVVFIFSFFFLFC